MKKKLTLIFILAASWVHAQYYQHWYNRSVVPANSSNETFYDGIRTRYNFSGANPVNYFNVGYGATFISPFGAFLTDQARFVRTTKTGAVVNVNTGTSFADNNTTLFHNSYGHAICEINNGLGTGGYLAVGNVASNSITGSFVPGGSDGLFYKMTNAGATSARFRFDSNGGAEYFTDIKASTFTPGTYYVCGYAKYGNFEDAIVMSILANGTVNWFKRYQFDPTWTAGTPTASAECRAYGIAEDASSGNLMVVGYIHDQVPAPSTGTDGLVFVINSAGAVICAQSHHVYDNDQYHDVVQKASGNFAICGFVEDGASGTSFNHTWLTEMSISCGGFFSSRFDHSTSSGNISESRGYALVERINTSNIPEYYVAGPDMSTAGLFSSINKISALPGNPPVAWYNYAGQGGGFDDSYGIDYATAANTKPGLLLLSNTNTPVATAPFNDCYMLKAYYNGATCTNYCPSNTLLQAPLAVAITSLIDSIYTPYKRKGMISQIVNYTYGVICTQNSVACGSNARDYNGDTGNNLEDENQIMLYPNPAENSINLDLIVNSSENYRIIATDITGRSAMLGDHYLNEGRQVIPVDIAGLAKGVYIMKISNSKETITKKFVVK